MAKPPTHLPCGTAHWSTEPCPASSKPKTAAEIAAPFKVGPILAETARCRELVAAWMLANGFATGPGDTIEDLLAELTWQTKERLDELLAFREKRNQERAATAERVRLSRLRKSKGEI